MAPTSPSNTAGLNPRSPLAIVFPILAALACVLYIPALVIHIRGRNFAASVLMVSFVGPNIFNFINPLIWPSQSPQNWWNGIGLCDIEVKLQLAFSVANVGAVACIFRQLAIIFDTDRTTLAPDKVQRIRKRVFEIGFCVVLPIHLMIAHYFVQTSRYYIYSVEGCRPSFDNSWVTIVLIFVWPLVLCIIATIYGGLATYLLIHYRRQFAVILAASSSSMTKSRFIRLFALSTSLMAIYLPLTIFTFLRNASFPRHAYSLKSVHRSGWSELILMVGGQVDGGFDRWIEIGTSFLVFPFFGLSQDARALYRSCLRRLAVLRLTKPKMNLSRQTPLVDKSERSTVSGSNQYASESCQSPSAGISITLHEDEPIEMCSSFEPGVKSYDHASQALFPTEDQANKTPCKEVQGRSCPRQAPAFTIWSDAQSESHNTSTPSKYVKNESELTERSLHQEA